MARKPRVVPFVPFPRDGDLDGLVQDGTIWERPKGAYLRFIDTGEIWSEYGQVDRGRVEFVRADGSVWDFTPSFRDTDSTTLGGSLGTLGDDSPSLLESQGMLPRGVLGPSLAESARFDDAVDDVDVVSLSTDRGLAAYGAYAPKMAYLLSDEAVESGVITQASQDRLRGLNNLSSTQAAVIDISARGDRIKLFQYMEEQLHGKPTGRSGESPSYRYESFPLGQNMAAMLRDGDRKSIDDFRARLKFLEDDARIQRRSVADIIGPVNEDDVRFLQSMAASLPVTTWHDHHIKELIDAYAARDFDKVRYHANWLDRNTASTGSLETQLDLASQRQYMVDNPELIDRLFLQTAGLKDYEYYTGHAFRRNSDKIDQTVESAKSDLAALRADEATGLSSALGIIPENRLVERAGESSGQYQDFDVISQILRDIEIGELAIQRLEDDGEHTLAAQFRERLAELKPELKEATKPQDIKVVFEEDTLQDDKLKGILRFIPGGAENEDLLRKIRKSTDGLSPEYRPKEIRIELISDSNAAGQYNSSTDVLTLTPRLLGLDEHLVIDREAGTIKRFNPDDGPDGLDIPLGARSGVTIGRLRNDFDEVGVSGRPLDEVAVHESVHRIDALLSADAFFRNKTRLEGDIENIQKQIDVLPENDREISVLKERLVRRQEVLRDLGREERDGDYLLRNDSPIRQSSQRWIRENRPWLEVYNREFEFDNRRTDHAYVSSILGYTAFDYLKKKHGVSKNTPGLDPKSRTILERTESMEVLAEVLTPHVIGRRRIPAGTDGEESNLPQMFDKYSKQIIPEELKFILTDRDWSEDDLPPLTALAGRQELDIAYSTDEARRVVRDVDQGRRGSLLPRVASDPSATSQMLFDVESEDRQHRILGELAQAQVDDPELFRDGVLVDKVWAPFSPPPHLAGSGLRDELGEATSWREVSQLLKGKRVVVFDTETAGRVDPDEVDEDRIVQLGSVVYVDGVIVDRFSMYVNVDYDELSDWSQANLIDAEGKPMSPEFLEKQPDMPTVLQEFMRFTNGDSDGSDVVFMAHNAAFDLNRMELERQRHDPDGIPSFDLDEVTYFDTMGLGNIAKRAGVEDGPGSASLKKLQEFFGLEDFSWHTADADSEMTGQVLWRLLDYMDENDVSLDGLDPVAGLERQREEFAEYEGKLPEFLRQKERLAELQGLSDQLRSDRDDMTVTLDELDTVRPSAPDFGLPPGPDKLTGWDKGRLTDASVPDIHEGKPLPVTDVVDGVHLGEDQKSLKMLVSELSTEDDLLPLQKKLEEAFELGGSLSGKQLSDATYEIFAAINDLITSRQRDTTGFTPSLMREYEAEVADNEAWVGSRFAKAIQVHWGEARSEVFHWDFLSERVKTVLGEEFGTDVSHEPSEIDAGIEEIFEIQELLTPFIDAWVRGQYSTTQKYLEDAGITELSVFRGTYIPNVVGDDDGLPSGREPSWTRRGLESWSTDLDIALGFAGNKFGTADDRIEEMLDAGELGEPTHVLQHDVIPAQLIMGIGYLDNTRIITGSLGQGEESEIVALGSSRPVNWLSNDLLMQWRSERPEGGYNFRIEEAAVFTYLSTGLWPRFS